MSFFGTDGIRGRAGEGKLSDDNVRRMGRAMGAFVGEGGTVVIGRDTRESGPGIQAMLEEGLLAAGVEVMRLGVLPTPGTALLTAHHGAELGIMITASHNPWHDNGVKLFSPDGRKLSDAAQARLEGMLLASHDFAAKPGHALHDAMAEARYGAHVLRSVEGADLTNLRVVVDGANGAGHAVLAAALSALNADVIAIGDAPDGRNINAGVGSTAPAALCEAVVANGADVGFALDGDADRILAVDETGAELDGDQIVARLALDGRAAGTLKGDAVVSTVMANLGLERWAEGAGLTLERTKVGDRHVSARMKEIGANVGGEPSGHILLTDLATTGDGCLTAVQLAVSLAASGKPASQHLQVFQPVPQVLKSVRFNGEAPLKRDPIKAAIAAQQRNLAGKGRLLVRASGTEPVIRVMAEGNDRALVSQAVDAICAAITQTA